MKKLFAGLLAIFALAVLPSCGTLKKSTQSTDIYAKEAVKSDVAETVIAKEKVDTVVTVVADTADASVAIEQATDTAITVIDTPTQRVDVLYDPISKRIRTKAVVKERQVPITIERESVTNRTDRSVLKTESSQSYEQTDVKKTNPLIPGWVLFLLILIVAAYFAWRIWKAGLFP